MRSAHILYKNEKAGILTELSSNSYTFKYTELWLADNTKPAISLTLPKTKETYQTDYLMPFFYNMLPEGTNKKIICTDLKIDEKDYFTLLFSITKEDTIGAITIEKI